MRPMPKITLVGAGSVVFSKTLICDILQYPALSDCTICLMDIDAQRLSIAEKLARRVVAQLGVKARIEATLDLRKACAGAKFAITAIQVGGYKPSTVVDFEIPAKYGVQQTIADTLGVGGVFRALRSIPELAKVARTLQEVGAPDPLLLNYTNPMAMNMWAINRLTGIDSVGLCHSVQGTSQQLATYCGLDYKDISYKVAGINHMAFFLKFEYKGKDAYPFLFRALDNPSSVAADRVRFEMMRRLGYFVTESSEHQSEYVPYFIHHGEEVIKEFGVPINEYIRRCESMIGQWDKIEQALLDESKPVEIGRSVEYGSSIIHSVVSGEPCVIYGNVPNRGLITNLRQGCCVEVPCLVDKQGLQPTHIGALPPQLAAIIHTNLNVQELTVEAAVTGQREYIYQAVMMDPHTATVLTLDKIWAMCDELIEAHQKDGYLGEFKPVVRNTGKPLREISRVHLSLEAKGLPFIGAESRKGTFDIVAENETDNDFDGEIELSAKGADITFSPSNRVRITVAAGQTARVAVAAEAAQEIEGDLKIAISSSSKETVERDFALPQRKKFDLPSDASGTKRLPFTVTWSGNTVAECTLWTGGGKLFLDAHINDTDLKTAPIFWDGSALSLAIKNPLLPDTPVIPIVVIPDPDEPKVIEWKHTFLAGDPLPGASACVTRDASGYQLRLELDMKNAGIEPGAPFLFDTVIHVNALGTAHGRVSASWAGSKEALFRWQPSFAILKPSA